MYAENGSQLTGHIYKRRVKLDLFLLYLTTTFQLLLITHVISNGHKRQVDKDLGGGGRDLIPNFAPVIAQNRGKPRKLLFR
jgi:hypothetical protein